MKNMGQRDAILLCRSGCPLRPGTESTVRIDGRVASQSMKYKVKRTAACLLLLMMTGCTWPGTAARQPVVTALPVDEAPRFQLFESRPAVSTVSHQLEPRVELIDERSDEEKRYYPGETHSAHSADAITVLPMESFEPHLEKMLSEATVRSLDDALAYQSIRIHVTSLHAALDERERAEKDHLIAAGRLDDEAAKELDDSEGFWKQDGDGQVARFMFWHAVVEPLKTRAARKKRKKKLTLASQTIPVSLTEGKKSGWNGCLQATVRLQATSGGVREIPVSVHATAPRTDHETVDQQVRGVLESMVAEFAGKLGEAERGDE